MAVKTNVKRAKGTTTARTKLATRTAAAAGAQRATARAARVSYMAECRRVGDWWAISVPEVPGVFTQARRLDQAEEMARDAIATMLSVPARSFDVVVAWEVPGGLGDDVQSARTLRELAELAQRDAGAAARAAAAKLLKQGHLTIRDIGTLLGMSHQRVSQLLEELHRS